jgi:hypothetical protein
MRRRPLWKINLTPNISHISRSNQLLLLKKLLIEYKGTNPEAKSFMPKRDSNKTFQNI